MKRELHTSSHFAMRTFTLSVAFSVLFALLLGSVNAQEESAPPIVDHLAHAVPGKDQTVRDEDGDGFAEVTLNGELSHTHYFQPGPPAVTGKLESFEWVENSLGAIIGTSMEVTYNFPVGVTVVTLTVVDSSGDVSANDVTVTVLPSGNQGAYIYFYDLTGAAAVEGEMPEIPAASHGLSVDAVNFNKLESFPEVPFLTTGPFAVRVVADYLAVMDDDYVFFVAHGGGFVQLFLDGELRISKTKVGTKQKLDVSKPFFLEKGEHKLELLYYTPDPDAAQLVLGINLNGGVQAVPNSFLSYETSIVLPTLHSITPDATTLGGGGQMKLYGAGFSSDSEVTIGPYNVSKVYVKSSDLIEIIVPSASAPAAVLVSVTTSRGTSNGLHFSYNDEALMPIKFDQTYVKNQDGTDYPSEQFTSVAIGPDLRYYFGSLDTRVHVLTVNHSSLIVQDSCRSVSAGPSRSITGVSFNPADKDVRVYISTNSFYWRNWKTMSDEDGWHNGKIETLVVGTDEKDDEVCLVHEKVVVSGMPVSNHDHGVNSLIWDNDGNLYAQVGGCTNAGVSTPDDLVGGVPESVLSAATIVVHLRAPGFDGKVLYDQYKDPGTAKKLTSDKFVEGFSYGFRNSYGSVFHSNGHIYATDNGPNKGYGKASVTCDTETDDPWHPDSLVLVHEDAYFGFPNRARGNNGDTRQCVYYDPTGTSRNGFTAALATFDASTNGLIEYTANCFQGQLKGDLLASKYAVAGSGKLYRVSLSASGLETLGETSELAQFSGLSTAMNPFGALIMPRVQQPNIAVLKPNEEKRDGKEPHLTAVVPNRGPKAGGNHVAITGRNIVDGTKVHFGDKLCKISRLSAENDWILCSVPAGSGAVMVTITTEFGTTQTITEDYYYLNY